MRIYCHPLVVDLDLRTQELDSCSNLAEKCVEHKRVHEHDQKQGQGVAEHEERELQVHSQSKFCHGQWMETHLEDHVDRPFVAKYALKL